MEAADTCRRLITLRHNDAHAHVSLGSVLMMKLCDFQAAKTAFREAKRLKSDDWMVRDLIANAWSDWGDWDAAVEERREVVRLGPSLRFVHNNLGFSLLGAGRTDEAVGTFREAIRRAPRFWPASLGLGRARLAKGEPWCGLGRGRPGRRHHAFAGAQPRPGCSIP